MDVSRVCRITECLIEARYKDVRKCDGELDLRAPLCPLFPASNDEAEGLGGSQHGKTSGAVAERQTVLSLLTELGEMHHKWALGNYIKVRNSERSDKVSKGEQTTTGSSAGGKTREECDKSESSPYLNYLSSRFDGVDSPVVSEILMNRQSQVVLECILLTLNQQNSVEYRTERFKKQSSIMLLLSDLLRAMERKKQVHCDTMDFHVLIDILFREMVIMRDLGFALFEYVSCLNIVIKCISSTKEKYRWGEATTLLSVTESLIEGFGVATS